MLFVTNEVWLRSQREPENQASHNVSNGKNESLESLYGRWTETEDAEHTKLGRNKYPGKVSQRGLSTDDLKNPLLRFPTGFQEWLD